MGVRAIRVRIDCDRQTLESLWRTHQVFNERLPRLLSILFKMRRAEAGANAKQRGLYQRIATFILARDSKDAPYLLHSVSIPNWTPNTAKKMRVTIGGPDGKPVEVTGDSWADEAAALSASGVLLYDKQALLGDIPDSLRQMVPRDAVACMSGHDELVKIWEKEHADWLHRKTDWEADAEHAMYLALRPMFESFEESVGGKAGKRRERWHLYLTWLRQTPSLAAWRGGPVLVNDLSPAALQKVKRAKPWKQRSVEADEFWSANPELRALDRLHGYYEREFIRRRKTKKNPDGFEHRPTFTLPHATLHPRWLVFNAPQTSPQGYADLRLPDRPGAEGAVRLRLLTADKADKTYRDAWVPIRFKSDPRLADFRVVKEKRTVGKGKNKGQTIDRPAFRFNDRQLGIERPAQISGAKLMFSSIRLNADGSLKSAIPYLVFAFTIDDVLLTERARAIKWTETGEVTAKGKKRKSKALPPGLVSCAVDLGLRNLGFLTVAVSGQDRPAPTHDGVRIIRARNQWLSEEESRGKHKGRLSPGPDLAHIGQHKRQIKRLRRLRGKPVKGEQSHVELQDHIDHMGQDRFKKAARAIVNFALNIDAAPDKTTGEVHPRADVLIMEKLEGFIPDAERQRGINRALVAWNRGQLITRIKEVAADVGLKVFEVHPAGTSQCCSKCGALGRRHSIARDDQTHQPAIRYGWVEKLFACPWCGYRANADHNASVNLHRRFVLDDKAVAAFFTWRSKTDAERERGLREMDDRLRPELERLHQLASPLETPF